MSHFIRTILASSAVAASTVFGIGAQAATEPPFTGFVGFGDSLSDKGRFLQLQPPSLEGRFSDGPTWMEIVGAEFEARGQGNFNLAVGGATAGPDNDTDPSYLAFDASRTPDPNNPDDIPLIELRNLSAQVSSFENAGFDDQVGDNPLVAILIGGNDFLQGAVDPFAVINNVVAGIAQVAALGPEFDSFLVANAQPSSVLPENAGLSDIEKALLDAETSAFNALFEATLAGVAGTTGLEIEIFDLFSETKKAQVAGAAAGLILDRTCTDTVGTPIFDPLNACLVPGSSQEFLFIDRVHPGSFVQSSWGEAAVAQISDRLVPGLTAVPLPAGMPLLLAGLGALVALRKRKGASVGF